MASSTPVTVTVRAVFQLLVSKVSDDGDAVPSLASRLVTVTVTAAKGRATSPTVKVAVPPPSVTCPLTAPNSSPYSLSTFTAYTLTGERPSYVSSSVLVLFTVSVTV